MWRYLSCVFLVGVLAAGACGGDETTKGLAEGCSINTDCSSPLVCAFRKCHQACTSSRDCQAGQRCVASDKPNYVCQLDEERNCQFNSDCPSSQKCGVDLQCRDECAADRDCLKAQLCVSSTCAEPTEVQDGGLPVRVPEGGQTSSAGQPCLYTSDCPDPLVCRDNVCANACAADSDCPAGSQCVDKRCVAKGTMPIGPEGGVVAASSGRVKLTVAPGSLKAPVSIAILALEAWPMGAIGPAFEIVPSGTVFDPPAALTFTYAPSDIGAIAPSDLRLGQAVGSKWTALTSTVDPAMHTVSASIPHLSVYGMLGPPAPAEAGAPVDASVGGPEASTDASQGGFDGGTSSDGAADQSVAPADATASADVGIDSGAVADTDAAVVSSCSVLGCTSGDGCCPYGCSNQIDTDCAALGWNTVTIGTVSYANPNTSFCETVGIYGITLGSNYAITTCSPTAQTAGSGDPIIVSIVDNLGNSYLDDAQDDCFDPLSIPRALDWTCVNATDETTMACTPGNSGFRTVSTGNISRIDVMICASGPTRTGTAPLYIFYNAPIAPHLG